MTSDNVAYEHYLDLVETLLESDLGVVTGVSLDLGTVVDELLAVDPYLVVIRRNSPYAVLGDIDVAFSYGSVEVDVLHVVLARLLALDLLELGNG